MPIAGNKESNVRRLIAILVSGVLATVLTATATAGAVSAQPNGPCCGQTLVVQKIRAISTASATPTVGEVSVAKGFLYRNSDSRRLGRYSSVQTVLSVAPNGNFEIHNSTVYYLTRGTITTVGAEIWSPDVAPTQGQAQAVSITGGTGQYAGVSGTATSTPTPSGLILLTFRFTNTR